MIDTRSKNYYEILEINEDAPREQIEQGYVQAKNAFSSDSLALYSLMTEDDCKNILNQIDEAYSILSIPQKRQAYDSARGFNQNHSNPEMLYQQHVKNPYEGDAAANTYREPINQSSSTPSAEPLNNTSAPTKPNYRLEEPYVMNKGTEVEVSKITAQNRFNLDYSINADFEQEIENATTFTGEFLQKIREYKQVTISRMSDMTKISKTYLQCIEQEDTERLPAFVYIRGFVYQYAKCLKLPPDLVAASYTNYLKAKLEQSA